MSSAVSVETIPPSPNANSIKSGEKKMLSSEVPAQFSKGAKGRNPFKLPADTDYGKVLADEKIRRNSKFKKMLGSPVHLKTPARHLSFSNVVSAIPPIPPLAERQPSPTSQIKSDPEYLQAADKGRALRNVETLKDFTHNKREMFHIQYMIGIKRDEITRLLDTVSMKEKKVNKVELRLENDAIKFSNFLRLHDREAVDAVKQAETGTKVKLDKISDIKKINILISAYKSKISKLLDSLLEYRTYAKFLDSVSPQEWIEKRRKETTLLKAQKETRAKERPAAGKKRLSVMTSSATSSINVSLFDGKRPKPPQTRKTKERGSPKDQDQDIQVGSDITANVLTVADLIAEMQLPSELIHCLFEDEEDERVELFFTSPSQLPAIFNEMEEQNLLLIQKNQESEDTLEEVQTDLRLKKRYLHKETKFLKEQVKVMEHLLTSEVEKANNYRQICQMHNLGRFEDQQELLMAKFSSKIEEVYTKCLGPNDANLDALHMMTCIENKMELLMATLEKLPPAKIAAALHVRSKQRRVLEREARAREMEEYLKLRRGRTLAKAMEIRKTYVGRRPLTRSQPPPIPKQAEKMKLMSRSEEDTMYFFS